jgi:uncharacterized lipoprotein
MKKILFACLLGTLLTSCSRIYGEDGYLKDHENDYLNAKSIPALKIPSGYGSNSIAARYPVAERNYPHSSEKVSIIPPGL